MKQITASLYQINLGSVNAYVIKDNGLTLIDTGYKGNVEKIASALQQSGEKLTDIRQIILTHCHPDHAGSAADLRARLGVPVLAHKLDAPLIEKGIGGRTPMHLSPGIINWFVYNLLLKRGTTSIDPVIVDERLSHNDVIPVAGGIRVLHTPGHSAGHIALLLKNEGVLIAGDLCSNVAGLDWSTIYEDRLQGLQSILEVADLNFDTSVFGHGNPLEEKANQKIETKFKAYPTATTVA